MKKSMFSSVEWLAGLSCGEKERGAVQMTVAGELSPSASFLSSPSPSSSSSSSSYYSLSSSSLSSSSSFFISSQSSLDEQRRAGSTSPDFRPNSCPSSPGSQHSSRSSSPAPCSSSSSPAATAAATSVGVTDEEEEEEAEEEEGDAPRHGPRRAAGFCRRARTAFSTAQLAELESSFRRRRYLSVAERGELGRQLGMSDLQVKTWFQNRRMKQKREELGARGGGAFPHVPAPPLFPLAPPLASWLAPLGARAPPLSAPPAFAAPPCCPYLLLY
uniref:BarH-like 1 homeobox protein isoform X2 n=1 Tax=Petromyzon marinus TaxID=7757 RepID=A0AAJ7SWD2_PETMA|nr:barH-like 1 homeobox protein isoform X2 [Petromyzon marinus]